MKHSTLATPVLLFTVVAALIGCGSPEPPSLRLIILGWDGMPDWVVDRLLEEGRLPGLARLAREGARADQVTPAYPSVTAHGWTALWTGAYGDVTNITGNSVPILPRSEHTLLESQSGFAPEAREGDPIWMSMLRAGRRVVILSASVFSPMEAYHEEMQAAGIELERLISHSPWEGAPIADARVFDSTSLGSAGDWQGLPAGGEPDGREFSFTVADNEFHVLVYGDAENPSPGLDTAAVCAEVKDLDDATQCDFLEAGEAGATIELWSRGFSASRDALEGRVYFRLFELEPDGSRMTFYQSRVVGVPDLPNQDAFFEAAGAVGDTVPFGLYGGGGLGPTLWNGGDGDAEARLLEIARLNADLFGKAIWFGLDTYAPDLLMHTTAVSDSAGHTWVGLLDPRKPGFDAALSERLWPVYAELLEIQDGVLDQLLDRVGPDTIVTVVSDHGMAAVGKGFAVNTVLERAGLLSHKPDGGIDLDETSILTRYPFFLNVNSTDWKGGTVGPGQIDAVLDRATEALLSAIDPDTGRHVVTRVFRPEEIVGLGIGGPAGGDLYMDFAPGYTPTTAPGSPIQAQPPNLGGHGFYPFRTNMQTIWFVGGGGILPGQELPPIRQIDIAPTLATLAGIEIPNDSRGHVIGQLQPDTGDTR